MPGRDPWRGAVGSGRDYEGASLCNRDLVEVRDTLARRDEPTKAFEQLDHPPMTLRRQDVTTSQFGYDAIDHISQMLSVLLRMLTHVGTSHTGAGHGPGGVCAPAGAI